MSDEALIAELERRREPASRWIAYYDSVGEGNIVLQKPGPDSSEVTGPVLAALTAHPVFGQGRSVFFAHKQLNLYPYWMPLVLLRMMLRRDAASAVAWFHRLFKIDRADLRMVAAVHGIEVQQPVSLSNGVRLLPFAAGPDSANLRNLARHYRVRLPPMDWGLAFVPTIAVFDMGSITASTEPNKAANDRAYDALLDAARAFTLIDRGAPGLRGAPVVGISWTDFIDPELTFAEVGVSSVSARFEGSPSQFGPVKVDDEAIAWTERYLKMDEQSRRAVGVALDRLNLARRRRSPGDQAIDSSICLEALLGDKDDKRGTYL
jgi:hypothetical protein